MTLYCGIDIGSTWVKGVALDDNGEVAATAIGRTGMSFESSCEAVMASLLSKGDCAFTMATGYGRNNAAFADGTRTEISCHAKGAQHHFPGECFVVDIGGQDNKVIHVREDGGVENFVLNRKCAAGTGAFIEEIARRLDIDLGKIEALAEASTEEITLSSFCTVFSATEVIQRIREGQSPENICRGIFNSVVARVVEMGTLGKRIVLTGGVAQSFPVVAKILAERADLKGTEVLVPPDAQYTGAMGAALFAREQA
jgi:predicted CoA-substrate-specific enzyme activase